MKINLMLDSQNKIYVNKYNVLIEEKLGVVEDNVIQLEAYEALYLIYKGRALLVKNNKQMEFNEALSFLVSLDNRCWEKFLVYNFFRDKGYYLSRGYGNKYDFLLYSKTRIGKELVSKYIVTIIHEGRSINIEEFDEMLNFSSRMRKSLILAIIDSNGDITTYEASKVKL